MAFMQDYSSRLFTELEKNFKQLTFKSVLHGNTNINQMSYNSFIFSYINMIDCLLKRYIDEIKHMNQETGAQNWKLIKLICIYGLYWSIGMFIINE